MMKIGKFHDSIGIPREKLPQIEKEYHDEILSRMQNDGITFTKGKCTCDKLSPSQADLSIDKVNGIVDSGAYKEPRTLFVSYDGFIIDGHHTWAAKYTVDPTMKIDIIRVDMNPIDLINWFNSQDFTYNRTVMESKK